ncbi:MAG: hypothetical protein LDL13_09060 [Calditerrivibrio sp.]|nr:hypothetical protein [Calditerrivibrio sp.]MCA1980445.1 hypothetical protein [Calditerrivibrio sp.]
MKRFVMLVLALFLFAFNSFAGDIKFQSSYTDAMFKSLAKEFGVALSFNPMSPAEPHGITGFDVSAEITFTGIDKDKDYWKYIFDDNDSIAFIPVPRLHVIKGLPFNIDVGAMYSKVPGTDVQLWGLELKYAILAGTLVTPALAVRGAFSKLEGVDELDINTQQLDLMVSKGILFLTPYAGVTALRINASESSSIVNLSDVHETIYRAFAGVSITPFPLLNFTIEGSIGQVNQLGIKFGLKW